MDLKDKIEIAIAAAQLVAALASLLAAWWIADSQTKRADQLELQRQIGYFDTVLGLFTAAIVASEQTISAVKRYEPQADVPTEALTSWAATIDGFISALRGQWPNAPPAPALVRIVAQLLSHMDHETRWGEWQAATVPDMLAKWCEPLRTGMAAIERERRFWSYRTEFGKEGLWDRLRFLRSKRGGRSQRSKKPPKISD
ncbi:MAG TPA: hypothetical protein VKQ54_08010 [Caulobacteraceae bacterium]|nr:hypothetical protein [Caulobacteraceae bacterium]